MYILVYYDLDGSEMKITHSDTIFFKQVILLMYCRLFLKKKLGVFCILIIVMYMLMFSGQ